MPRASTPGWPSPSRMPASSSGVFNGQNILAGGRILYSSPRNVSTKGSFDLWSADRQIMKLNYGGVVPAWNGDVLAVAHLKYGKITAFDTGKVSEKVKAGFEEEADRRNRFSRNIVNALTARNEERWQSQFGHDRRIRIPVDGCRRQRHRGRRAARERRARHPAIQRDGLQSHRRQAAFPGSAPLRTPPRRPDHRPERADPRQPAGWGDGLFRKLSLVCDDISYSSRLRATTKSPFPGNSTRIAAIA